MLLPEILKQHGYSTVAVTGGGWMDGKLGFAQGFDSFVTETRGIEAGTSTLVSTLDGLPREEYTPTFAFFHTYQIHSPYAPPGRYRTMFGEHDSSFEPTSENLLKVHEAGAELSENDLNLTRARYDGEIRYTDDTLRKMFRDLDTSGFLHDALVIITSDHGEEFGEHGSVLHGSHLYDELLKVPLIILDTSKPEGRVDERMVSTIDIVPTILGSIGIPVPAGMEGGNLLDATMSTRSDSVFSQYGDTAYSVRTRRWKLIRNKMPATTELYDMVADPAEKNNIAATVPEQVSSLSDLLQETRERARREAAQMNNGEGLSPGEIERLKSLGYLQ